MKSNWSLLCGLIWEWARVSDLNTSSAIRLLISLCQLHSCLSFLRVSRLITSYCVRPWGFEIPGTASFVSSSAGKIGAQCSHATLACYKYYFSKSPDAPILKRWERGGQAKVALQVKSEEEMLVLQTQALSLGLCARVIQDAGRTQIASGSRTVLGILGPKSVVDAVTGHLKLL